MATKDFYLGQRLSYDGHLCTVRYIGLLQGTKGEWLGVEWDDLHRGKHNGTHKGHRVFDTLSHSPTSASFIKPNNKLLVYRTVLEAIEHKYGAEPHANGSIHNGDAPIEISGKTVEEIGFQKIKDQQSQLSALKIVLIDELNVKSLRRQDQSLEKARRELLDTCPRISELDLGWNPLETWQDIAEISAALPNLKILKASGLRLRSFDLLTSTSDHAFDKVEELHLNENLLSPQQLLTCLFERHRSHFPSLRTLWLSQNELSHCQTDVSYEPLASVTTLMLENNLFHSVDQLSGFFKLFPNLKSLSVQGNKFVNLAPESSSTLSFPSLEHLNLASNYIASWSFIDRLPTVFPNLTSLRISQNPVYSQPSTVSASTADASYYLTLARIPLLKTLNYTTITVRDREEGEIYYLSVAEKDIRSILSSSSDMHRTDLIAEASAKYPLYTSLCAKYDRDSTLVNTAPIPSTTKTAPQYAPGTLGARLINTTFYIPGADEKTFTRFLPPSISVYSLKALLQRRFKLPPLSFRLVYESNDLDPVQITTTKFGKNDLETWGDWDADIPPPIANVVDEKKDEEKDTVKAKEVEEKWVDGYLIRDGTRWQKRQVEILDGWRSWSDFIDSGVKDARIRIELKK